MKECKHCTATNGFYTKTVEFYWYGFNSNEPTHNKFSEDDDSRCFCQTCHQFLGYIDDLLDEMDKTE